MFWLVIQFWIAALLAPVFAKSALGTSQRLVHHF
jgi:hypothetical protein